ncbi:MAG: succinylglutamate desuccinylase/aspartoacylase family protein [Lachnospiraceae bacterium]|nr:succinylglutamate desuccinylase/aspartoacylase family protein [Lachnospiraceae bacterium]
MEKIKLYEQNSLYRDNLRIMGYQFGNGKQSLCIVGAMRGNEIQQLYICSQLVKIFKELEEQGEISKNKSVLIVPCVNSASVNIEKRFWSTDNTDINRMFPGYAYGETTQRIAAGLFEKIKDYQYGIQLASFYMPGNFIPHVRMMKTGYEDVEEAKLFGLPYVLVREPKPYDTTTLNYNWQVWETDAFSIYSSATDTVDQESAKIAIDAILRFAVKKRICKYNVHSGYISEVIGEVKALKPVKTKKAGILDSKVKVNEAVRKGQVLAEIIDTYEGDVIYQVTAPEDGIVFFIHNKPIVYEDTVVIKML